MNKYKGAGSPPYLYIARCFSTHQPQIVFPCHKSVKPNAEYCRAFLEARFLGINCDSGVSRHVGNKTTEFTGYKCTKNPKLYLNIPHTLELVKLVEHLELL